MPPRIRRRITSSKREEIEKEQEQLSRTIVRPFDVLNGLPVSFNPPPNGHYEDVLKQPLTIKDTGVLYRSLMKSRYYYVHVCPMFQLYWVKQSSYAKKLAEQDKPLPKSLKEDILINRKTILGNEVSARDVMVKLCDAAISLGPHTFEIRLFIAKDGRPEKMSKKEEKRLKALKEAEEKQKLLEGGTPEAKDQEKQPNSGQAELQTSKDELGIEQKQDNETKITEPEGKDKPEENKREENKSEENKSEENKSEGNKSEEIKPEEPESSPSKEQQNEESEHREIIKERSKEIEKDGKEEITDKHEEDIEREQESGFKEKGDADKSKSAEEQTAEIKKSVTDMKIPEKSASEADVTTIAGSGTSSSSLSPIPSREPSPPRTSSSTSTSTSKNDPNNMSSIENQIMIANLNFIARKDESLNSLMKIVASGKATAEQISTFQAYIKRAREMGPPPHDKEKKGKKVPKEKKPPKEKKEKKPKEPKAPKEPKPPKEPKVPKQPKEKKPKKLLKSQIPKDQRLTAFQERYIMDAILLFEFVENPNVRFMIPKNAICEVLPPSTMTNAEGEDNSDNRDILVSFLWIHNQNEVDEYESKLAEYNKKVKEEEEVKKAEEEKKRLEEEKLNGKQKEAEASGVGKETNENPDTEATNEPESIEAKSGETTQVKEEEEEEEENEDEDDEPEIKEERPYQAQSVPAKRRAPPRRSSRKKRKAPARKAKPVVPRKLEPPVEPEYKFTAFSFTIHGIPSRFVPIFTNSVKPLVEVQERISRILTVGTRISTFYLWYQMDGKLDEPLAEDIRMQLNQEEKKFTGIPTIHVEKTPSQPKKRKPKDKDGEGKKKAKKESDINNEDLVKVKKEGDQAEGNSADTEDGKSVEGTANPSENKSEEVSTPSNTVETAVVEENTAMEVDISEYNHNANSPVVEEIKDEAKNATQANV